MITTAITVATWLYRGSTFTIPVTILDEDGEAVELLETDTAHLQLFYDHTDSTVIVEKEASSIYTEIGLVVFTLDPEDTEGLLDRTYEFSVHIVSEDEVYPVLTSKLGIVAFNPPIEEA